MNNNVDGAKLGKKIETPHILSDYFGAKARSGLRACNKNLMDFEALNWGKTGWGRSGVGDRTVLTHGQNGSVGQLERFFPRERTALTKSTDG